LDLLEGERERLDRRRAVGVDAVRGEPSVLDRDFQVLLLLLAGLAAGEGGLLDRLVDAQRLHDDRRSPVDILEAAQLVHGRLARWPGRGHRALRLHTPIPTRQQNLFLMLLVARLALDRALPGELDLEEEVLVALGGVRLRHGAFRCGLACHFAYGLGWLRVANTQNVT